MLFCICPRDRGDNLNFDRGYKRGKWIYYIPEELIQELQPKKDWFIKLPLSESMTPSTVEEMQPQEKVPVTLFIIL